MKVKKSIVVLAAAAISRTQIRAKTEENRERVIR